MRKKMIGAATLAAALASAAAVGTSPATSTVACTTVRVSQPVQVVSSVQFGVSGACGRARGYAASLQIRVGPTEFGPWTLRTRSWRSAPNATRIRGTVPFLGKRTRKNWVWVGNLRVQWFMADGSDGARSAETTPVLYKLR